jgi:signal transduction histidine kinase
LIPYIITAGFFLLIFTLLFNMETNLLITVISIPSFVFLVLSGNKISQISLKTFRKFQFKQNENLDQKMEDFSTRIVQLIDMKQLWDLTTKFLREIFEFQKIAIVSFQYDVSPYQIEALVDVNQAEFRKIISESNSPVMEVLESDRNMVNKFVFTNDSLIYKKMESMNMYLAIPLVRQNKILGFIFLGGEQKFVRIPHRYLQLIKLLCSQIAFAIDNIRTIQRTLQARKMAEIGVLASQLAHDFQSFIGIVKMENRDNNLLYQQATYAEKLVQDLLNYARPQDLRLNLVNINDLIDMSLDLIELQPNIVIEKNYAENLPEINLDIDQIRRVFKILIENSSRALKDINNKRLKITTRQLRPISKIQRNPWIYVEVLDEGVGIPEELLDKIFDPFFTTNKNEGGNGLGLAIVKQIITRHHGFIDVTSRPGKGTIFSIRLPHIII